jgi:hypothetical protein
MVAPDRTLLPRLGGPDRRQRSVPFWLKLAYGVAVPVIAAVYWRAYGPQNYLWLSDIGLGLTAAAVWTGSRTLASMPAVGVLPLELMWSVDFLTGGRLLGLAAYMFDDELSLYLRSLSLFHFALPPTLAYLLYRFRYDRWALLYQMPLTWAAFIATYGLTDPDENINWVFGPNEPQELMPPLAWLGLVMIVYPLAVMLPTHFILKRLFRPRAAPTARGLMAEQAGQRHGSGPS